MSASTQFIICNVPIISLTLLLVISTCQCLPQLQSAGRNNNNNFGGQEGRPRNNDNNNRLPITTTNRPRNRGQRILEGGFVPSNFGNDLGLVRFPDGTSRPVGRGQPQRSPFRLSDAKTPAPVQNVRRPKADPNLQNQRRPDNTRQPSGQPQLSPFRLSDAMIPDPVKNVRRPKVNPNLQDQRRPDNTRQQPSLPQRRPRLFQPALPVPFKYTRPRFDVLGNPIRFKTVVADNEESLPDFRDPTGTKNRDPNQKAAQSPGFRRPNNSNLGPDLRPKLPIFGQPELILKATEELRNSDVNQNAIIKLGSVNAGVLPLATENEDDQQLGFFPPFNIRKPQPK